jgi:hypothetical protein
VGFDGAAFTECCREEVEDYRAFLQRLFQENVRGLPASAPCN